MKEPRLVIEWINSDEIAPYAGFKKETVEFIAPETINDLEELFLNIALRSGFSYVEKVVCEWKDE
jgi:hypothetical protein